MKKLTVAIAVVSTLHLHSENANTNEFISGTSFEKYLHGYASCSLEHYTGDDGYFSEEVYWHFSDGAGSYIVTNLESAVELPPGVSRPIFYTESTDTNVLRIEDSMSYLLRTVHKS